ncbi:MAG: PfkB family carbohydrate kinase, partial [Pseudomonadota bacterium]
MTAAESLPNTGQALVTPDIKRELKATVQACEELSPGVDMADVIVVGSFVQDFAFRTPDFPAPGETRIGGFATGPGGKGFNQAVACCRQGVETLFIGACGEDMFGAGAKSFAEANALRYAFETLAEEPSGAASIVIDDTAQT